MDSSLFWTVCFVPGEKKPLHKFFLLINYGHPINIETFYGPSVFTLMGFNPS